MSHVADMDILLEEEADERRVVEENHLAQYVAVIKQKQAEADALREAKLRADQAASQQESRDQLVLDLERDLRLSVPAERVRIEETGTFGEWYPAVEYGGVTFALRYRNSEHSRSYKVHVSRPCCLCGGAVWESVRSPAELVYELEREHAHDYACRQQHDEDGEPITDREGNPLPPRPKFEYVSPVEIYTTAIKTRRQLQFERAKVKELAIRRILANKGVTVNGETFAAGSASAAEKLVEFDEGYAAHCAALTDAVIAEITARELLIAADGKPGKEDEEM